MGTIKKNRFEPSHALALSLREEAVLQWVNIPADQEDMEKYLKGSYAFNTCTLAVKAE